MALSILYMLAGLIAAPLLPGVINRIKARFAGRTGQPLLQLYYDLWKLLRKGSVYSRTTSWVFRAGPVVGLAAVLVVMALMPFGGAPAPVAFPGDLILFAYLLGLLRFFTVLAALDTGSAFEGMGASREVTFSALAEPALLLGLAVVARRTVSLSLSGMFSGEGAAAWAEAGPAILLVAGALLIIVLAENARIPVDDPNTHLELTMIHEVMVLDHSGPDFAFIQYAAALKLWVLGALLVQVLIPVRSGSALVDGGMALAAMLGLAALVGVIESLMARLRLVRVPQLLVAAVALAGLAMFLVTR
ncbi:MAG: NADH-quinone oxidoreductase subunit H [Kiritimatiellae bacterium]|nr:NADH-quinone oxidoreductase subunit H [Kiritimatiellia bacterium]